MALQSCPPSVRATYTRFTIVCLFCYVWLQDVLKRNRSDSDAGLGKSADCFGGRQELHAYMAALLACVPMSNLQTGPVSTVYTMG